MPTRYADRVLWMQTFRAALPQYATTLGLTAAELQNAERDIDYFVYTVQAMNDAEQYMLAMTQYRYSMRSNTSQATIVPMPALPVVASPPPAVPPGIVGRINTLVLHIKRSAGYTTSIGQALQLIPPATVSDPNEEIPTLTVRLDNGRPYLKWKKKMFDGMTVYVDRGDGNGFVRNTRTVKRDFLDTAPLPEGEIKVTWIYKIRGFIGDDELGQFSQEVRVTVVRI